MKYAPTASRGGWIGIAITAVLSGVAAGCAWYAVRSGPGPTAVLVGVPGLVCALLSGRVAYWTWGFFTLGYELSRDALVIRWAASRHVVPMGEITHVLGGREPAGKLQGWSWPGYHVGNARIDDDDGVRRDVLVFATAPAEQQVLVLTPTLGYAISPADSRAFAEDFVKRRRLGVQRTLDHHTERAPWADLSIWDDRLALSGIVVAVIINLVALGWLAWHYPELSDTTALRFGYDPTVAAAVPSAVGERAVAWRFPVFALLGLALNVGVAAWIHSRARLASRLLIVGAAVVQTAMGVLITRIAWPPIA